MNGCTFVEPDVLVCHASVQASWFARCFVHGWAGPWRHDESDAVRDAEEHYENEHRRQ